MMYHPFVDVRVVLLANVMASRHVTVAKCVSS